MHAAFLLLICVAACLGTASIDSLIAPARSREPFPGAGWPLF